MNSDPTRYAEVWLKGHHIGWLSKACRTTRFLPTENYRSDDRRQTLSHSITEFAYESWVPGSRKGFYDPVLCRENDELPPFFAGLLPEGALRGRLAASRERKLDTDDFGILVAAGEDLPGAVTVVPADIDKLTNMFRSYGAAGSHGEHQVEVPEKAALGAASLAGVQDKLALSTSKEGQQYCLPSKGRVSDVVAKLPSPGDDTQIMNEYACMRLAALAGVDVARATPRPMDQMADHPDLVERYGAKTRFLAVERFDRSPAGAVHMEDACQLLGLMPGKKYAGREKFVKLFSILNRFSIRGIEDVHQLFTRQVVNTLIGNSDAHLKNFSVLYRDEIHPELSPAYDIVCMSALPEFRELAINVAIEKRQRAETLADYEAIAREAGISHEIVKNAVMQTSSRAQTLWPDALKNMEVSRTVREKILERLKILPLAAVK
ncbi:type II toxin-antitoxin system HipA family toxin [Herbaspirillum robiniae]|uniref:Regulator n=1 Tax=Herbaspirillum robiniae TaxID=2014887 RepID=A0A246WR31_9BURK|nr:HipA domain-containing protein [Herbaspirillum robiniae]OWY28518.1 regulator [Herbaspirillum robiniae]